MMWGWLAGSTREDGGYGRYEQLSLSLQLHNDELPTTTTIITTIITTTTPLNHPCDI